jgi:hypothetical protein
LHSAFKLVTLTFTDFYQYSAIMASTEQPPAPSRGLASVKLQSFWPNSPAAWFNNAEAQFIVRDITDPVDKYYLVAASLNEQQLDMVHHILKSEVTADSYERLRNTLVASHSLTNFQKVDLLVTMEPLGRRKPSELMAAMERLRPPSDGHFFVYHFLQRLSCEVRILLSLGDCFKKSRFHIVLGAFLGLIQKYPQFLLY